MEMCKKLAGQKVYFCSRCWWRKRDTR